jgi:hypothetical protein
MDVSKNPYKSLSDRHFWRRSVSVVDRHLLDPVVDPKFTIDKNARVATAGSCFAQHISRRLQAAGFNYYVTENAPKLSSSERARRNYSVYSARYGNIYTARQLIQLYDEAFSGRVRSNIAWRRADLRYVDACRPNIEPDGFGSIGEMQHERARHLTCVREIFEKSDIFVFTMGLTEGWRSRSDGSVLPLAPGVVAGTYSPAKYEFVNFNVAEVEQDMREFLDRLKRLNSKVKVLLTVSPVPLIATYSDRHVLSATTYSKSVLRVAAETLSRSYDWVDYFPSYEIITGSFNRGMYYEDDFREVNELGVSHAMRCFFNNYVNGQRGVAVRTEKPAVTRTRAEKTASVADVVCDEESIDQINR